MGTRIRVRAPAKINLHLRVYKRRDDGYHGIRSLFQTVSLADELIVGSLKEKYAIEIEGVFDCPIESTTVFKAVRVFREATGIQDGVFIKVAKRIPAGGGLGGGSSDAEATLRALNELFSTGLSVSNFTALGLSIGSDVPFFVLGSAALVTGRGEIVETIQARQDFGLILVFPGVAVNTASAYALLDKERPDDSMEADPDCADIVRSYQEHPSGWLFANSFERPIIRVQPRIARCLELLEESGADFSRMSGSGSTVFGVFADPDMAEEARGTLSTKIGSEAMVRSVRPLARKDLLD